MKLIREAKKLQASIMSETVEMSEVDEMVETIVPALIEALEFACDELCAARDLIERLATKENDRKLRGRSLDATYKLYFWKVKS